MNDNEKKVVEEQSFFTTRNILKILAILCIVFVFCPSFLVSCSGQEVNISVMTAVSGISSYGQQLVDPYPIMLICVILPVIVLWVLFSKRFEGKKASGIILGCTVADLIIWFIFKTTVEQKAEEYRLFFETTGWYYFNIIVLITVVILAALVMMDKIKMETNMFSHAMIKANPVSLHISSNTRCCTKCGAELKEGSKFCTACGATVSDAISGKEIE